MMRPFDDQEELVVPTPERVAFQYSLAGLGSRFMAQLIDLFVIVLMLLTLGLAATALNTITHRSRLAILIFLILGFIVLFGYFLVSEATLNGQTLGKRALRLRVVGDRGEPLTFTQAAIRNLVRIVDFLPFGYGIGLIAIFANGRGKRLGDLAAGSLVVRDRQSVSLYDLGAAAPSRPAGPEPQASSIWDAPAAGREVPAVSRSQAEVNQRLEPALRQLVVAYASRRNQLPVARRQALAQSAEPALRKALPELFASQGALAVLDHLAGLEGAIPERPMVRRSKAAFTLGIISLVTGVILWFPVAIICGVLAIIFGTQGIRMVRAEPHRFQGEDRARTGRLLGIIGLAAGSLAFLFVILTATAGR
jgi:uncharacterized RDD family membrane protein YckC